MNIPGVTDNPAAIELLMDLRVQFPEIAQPRTWRRFTRTLSALYSAEDVSVGRERAAIAAALSHFTAKVHGLPCSDGGGLAPASPEQTEAYAKRLHGRAMQLAITAANEETAGRVAVAKVMFSQAFDHERNAVMLLRSIDYEWIALPMFLSVAKLLAMRCNRLPEYELLRGHRRVRSAVIRDGEIYPQDALNDDEEGNEDELPSTA